MPRKKEIQTHLNKIVCSEIFKKSKKICEFLSFIVNESLKKDGLELKQYNIAVVAFGRNPDFDPIDPIVRIQAKRLRNNLNFYYQKEGINDTVIISLPKGNYVPQFSFKNTGNLTKKNAAKKNTLAIHSFKNLNKDRKNQYLVDGFSEELLMEISRYNHIQLLRASDENTTANNFLKARFSLRGSIRFTGESVKIFISVIDNLNHHQIWSSQQKLDVKQIDWIKIQEDIAIKVGQQITDITGILFESLSGSSNWQKTDSSQAYDAMLLFHQYNNNLNGSDIELVINRLENILKTEPEIGYIWAVLANIYTDKYVFSGDDKTYLDKALKYAKKAVHLQPNNQVCHSYYAYPLFINGDKKLTNYHLNKALELNPNSPYFMSSIGWCFSLNGEWKKGLELVEKSIKIDCKYPKWVHMAPFFHFILKEDYVNAYEEAFKFDMPDVFWDPLVKLVACYKLNMIDEANVHLSDLLLLKPNFIENNNELVGYLVKSKSLKEVIHNSIKEIFAFKAIKIA